MNIHGDVKFLVGFLPTSGWVVEQDYLRCSIVPLVQTKT